MNSAYAAACFRIFALATGFLGCSQGSAMLSEDAEVLISAAKTRISADFSQDRYMSSNGRHYLSRGKVLIDADRGLCWKTTEPVEIAVLLDGGVIETYGSDGEIIESGGGNLGFGAMASITQKLASGDIASLEKDFEIGAHGAKGARTFVLVPKNETLGNFVENIAMRIENGFASEVTVSEKGGGKISISFEGAVSEDDSENLLRKFCGAPDN